MNEGWQQLCVKERAAFEQHFKSLDFTTKPNDRWSAAPPHPVYIHPNIDSMWDGWWARATSGVKEGLNG
jgi:hypothetical protein